MLRLTLTAFVVLALCCAPQLGNAWNGYGAPFYYRAFEVPYLLEFGWSMQTTGNDVHLIGTFNTTVPDGMWFSIGTNSPADMDGLMIICVIQGAGSAFCDDYYGQGYDLDLVARQTQVLSHSINSDGTRSLTFTRIAVRNGVDAGDIALGIPRRVIWGWGPMEGNEPEEHPGEGIAGCSIDFQSGRVVYVPKQRKFIVYALTYGLTVVIALILRVVHLASARVHHKVRTVASCIIPLLYLAAIIIHMVIAYQDYNEASSLGPIIRAAADSALFCYAGLLLTVSRRFFFSEWFYVSHERAIKYHMAMGILVLGFTIWHTIGMIGMYFGAYILKWQSQAQTSIPGLPGLLALIGFSFCVVFALTRFELSYKLFRITHFLWVPSTVFMILHYRGTLPYVIPGLFFIVVGWLYGRIVNCSARVTNASFDQTTRTLILEVTRDFYAGISPTGCCSSVADSIGCTPAQWFYIALPEISFWQYHPFSIARADVITDPDTGKRVQKIKFAIKETNGTGGGGGIIRNGLQAIYKAAGLSECIAKFKEGQSWTTATCRHYDTIQGKESKIPLPIPVSIEGAFGSVQLPITNYRNIFLVSGGIGVTPNLFIFQHLAFMAAAGEKRWDNITFLWINRDDAMIKLLAADITEFADKARAAGVNVSLRLFVTRGSEPSSKLKVHGGDEALGIVRGSRPDFDAELKSMHEAIVVNTAESGSTPTAALYSCGPVPMIDSATEASDRAPDLCGLKVHVHTEVFDV